MTSYLSFDNAMERIRNCNDPIMIEKYLRLANLYKNAILRVGFNASFDNAVDENLRSSPDLSYVYMDSYDCDWNMMIKWFVITKRNECNIIIRKIYNHEQFVLGFCSFDTGEGRPYDRLVNFSDDEDPFKLIKLQTEDYILGETLECYPFIEVLPLDED